MSSLEMSLGTASKQAAQLDQRDSLAAMREEFFIPRDATGAERTYLVGNSLGLQPRQTSSYVERELAAWRDRAVRGHFSGEFPWMPYHEFLNEPMARLIGAHPEEVVMMNSLTVNLHLMLATFWNPLGLRTNVLIESGAFPSDQYAVESHLRLRGIDPSAALVLAQPTVGKCLDPDRLCQFIDDHHDRLCLVLLPAVQYYTGQVLDVQRIVEHCHRWDILAGFDLAHAAGNIELRLHDWDVDFAVWCTYKYLNSGPGSVGGCFVHERHMRRVDLPRLAGWWGHDKASRFSMREPFRPIATAEGWQISNPPILSMAAIRSSLDVFQRAGGMAPLVNKSKLMTAFFRDQLEKRLPGEIEILTPVGGGCQLSLKVRSHQLSGRTVKEQLDARGFETDWREPDVIRAAPVPLYNRFADIEQFVAALEKIFSNRAEG